MDRLRPESAGVMSAHRREAIRLAKAQQAAVTEKCKRSNQEVPAYVFDELIGKGSFGRVYKGRRDTSNQVVAIKVLDIDDADFQVHGEQRDEQIRDFNKEIRILQQAQDSGAENLNQFIDAFPVHSQLWLICEYCPGGSVKTLMRATNDKLAEKYLVVVARELGKALKGLHEAGIIHRDVKAANVLVHEEGSLQLCDFGVAGVLETHTDKRRTFIGTLHWMPPELWSEKPDYSDEVDVWEYGCTLYECAVGRPPNSDLREPRQLQTRMRRLKQAITLPEDSSHSDQLRSLVERTLSPNVATRPSMKDVLKDEFIADTEESHPTKILTELVQTYYTWLLGGGQRVSLFMPGGAVAVSETDGAETNETDEWNFSMTQDFERRVSTILEIPDFNIESAEGEETPRAPIIVGDVAPERRTAAQVANFEARVQRGAGLGDLFNENAKPYEYIIKSDFVPVREPQPRRVSDLPLRAMAEDRPNSIATAVIDLGDFDEGDYAAAVPRTDGQIQTTYPTPAKEETFRLADVETLKAKRAGSKGPRETSATRSLNSRRKSSAEETAAASVASQDFASQDENTIKDVSRVPELQEAAEIKSIRDPKHATMEWSFQAAMSAVPVNEMRPEEVSPEEKSRQNDKVRKHVTLEWSFASAMAEVDDGVDLSRRPSRATPKRPNILRTMTMPVTSDEVHDAEDMPRPLTAMSETPSESSLSSADFDPFGLDTTEDDHPWPVEIDDPGIANYSDTRGNTIIPRQGLPNFDDDTTSSIAYPLGKPARIGENGFPGPTNGHLPSPLRAHGQNGSVESNGSAMQVVAMPEPEPPAMTVMAGDASAEELEKELDRLLGDFHESLQAAYVVVQGRKRRGRGRARPNSNSDWEDED